MDDEAVEINVNTEPPADDATPVISEAPAESAEIAFTLGQVAERATNAEANSALALARVSELEERITAMQHSEVVSDLIDSSIAADQRAAEAEEVAEAVVEAAEDAAEESTGEELDFEIVDTDAPVVEVTNDAPPEKGHFFTRTIGRK